MQQAIMNNDSGNSSCIERNNFLASIKITEFESEQKQNLAVVKNEGSGSTIGVQSSGVQPIISDQQFQISPQQDTPQITYLRPSSTPNVYVIDKQPTQQAQPTYRIITTTADSMPTTMTTIGQSQQGPLIQYLPAQTQNTPSNIITLMPNNSTNWSNQELFRSITIQYRPKGYSIQ